jgi:hypothetical protein
MRRRDRASLRDGVVIACAPILATPPRAPIAKITNSVFDFEY